MILFGNYEYFYDNKIKQPMSITKEPFNKQYIDFIIENHQQMYQSSHVDNLSKVLN